MHKKTRKLLGDIQDAICFILEAVRDLPLSSYQSDRMRRQAIERNFEIIGEAVNRIVKVDKAIIERISHYSQIIAFRNVLSHGYDLIDDEQVWHVIQESLPSLLQQIEAILKEAEE
ncbi:MAG: HepT-like ribonuclease domain-containing protein [Planctomycetota bacterium]